MSADTSGERSYVKSEMLKLEPWKLAKGEFLGGVEGTWHTGWSLDGE